VKLALTVAVAALLAIVIAMPGGSSATVTKVDCPLAQKRLDFNCSQTLAGEVMIHSAPSGIANDMSHYVAAHRGKDESTAQKRLGTSKWRRLTRGNLRSGIAKTVDGKNAKDAGRWLKDWFQRHASWPLVRSRRYKIAAACGVGAALGYGFTRYYDNKSQTKAEHDAIRNCVTSAITVYVFG